MKAKLGMRKVRPWKWMPFKNPARKDDLVLYHWRRATEKGQDYAFAKFNKKLEVWKPLRFILVILHSDVKCLIFVLFHISKRSPRRLAGEKEFASYNHKTTIWVSHEYYLNPEFHKILWRAF